jgi:hypothetical protein
MRIIASMAREVPDIDEKRGGANAIEVGDRRET